MDAEWDNSRPSIGPIVVRIHLAEGAPADIEGRGFTTGVARRLESELTGMRLDPGPESREEYDALVRQIRGKTPQAAGPDYYTRFLRMHELAARITHTPLVMMAESLGVPRGTIANRIVTAQRHRERRK